jgi:ATP-dependent protease ClpP protease subunit
MIESGYEIIITVQDIAFSAAFFMLICGSKRRAYKGSRIMAHASNSIAMGRHQDIIDDLEETEAIWQKLKDITIKQTKITNEKLEELKKYKIDWYFWADEALEMGIIDEII